MAFHQIPCWTIYGTSMQLHVYGSKIFGEKEHYTAMRKLLDPARHILRSHPTIERVMSPIIGKDDFWIQVLGNGQSICLTDLLAGLMVRASKTSQ